MNKIILILITILILSCQKAEVSQVIQLPLVQEIPQEIADTEMYDDGLDSALDELEQTEDINSRKVKTFRIKAEQWSFTPAVIQINKDDYIILEFLSLDLVYDIKMENLGIERTTLYPGIIQTVEFIPNNTGTFTYTCTLQCPEHPEMNGIIHVK